MRTTIFAACFAGAALAWSAPAVAKGGGHSGSHGGSHSVRGHVTKKGTYVPPHHATNRDSTRKNNWSHKGNVNPYTGKEGTKD